MTEFTAVLRDFVTSTMILTGLLSLLYTAISAPEDRRSGKPIKTAFAVGIFGGVLHCLVSGFGV